MVPKTMIVPTYTTAFQAPNTRLIASQLGRVRPLSGEQQRQGRSLAHAEPEQLVDERRFGHGRKVADAAQQGGEEGGLEP